MTLREGECVAGRCCRYDPSVLYSLFGPPAGGMSLRCCFGRKGHRACDIVTEVCLCSHPVSDKVSLGLVAQELIDERPVCEKQTKGGWVGGGGDGGADENSLQHSSA